MEWAIKKAIMTCFLKKESYAKFRVGTMTTVAMFINKYQWLRNIYS